MQIPKYFYYRVKTDRKGLTLEVEDASDVDVVEVVRCKDCKHSFCDVCICCRNFGGVEVSEDWYCADGERKGGDE